MCQDDLIVSPATPAMPLAILHRDGAVSVVTLNRPERLNAIGLPLLTDLHAALQ